MNWLALAGTALGAVIALTGSLLTGVRTGRDQLGREREAARRSTYIDFATALDKAHASLRTVLREPGPDRAVRAREVINESGVFRIREQLLMLGATAVAKAGEAAFFALLAVRDVAASDADLTSDAYHDAYHDLADRLWNLRMVVRSDIGERPFEPAELGHADWSERKECTRCASRIQGQ